MRARAGRIIAAMVLSGGGLAGCGLDIAIQGAATVTHGQTAQYAVTLTNTSACPLYSLSDDDDGDVAFLPLVPAALVEDSELLALFCGQSSIPPPAMSTALAQPQEVPLPELRAQLSAVGATAVQNAACSGAGLTCQTVVEDPITGVVCSLDAPLAPGAMLSLSCQGTVPAAGMRFYTLAFSDEIVAGVCTNATPAGGEACGDDEDCGMGGACATGICVGGTNAGFGCNDAGACPDGTCTDCSDNVALGLACLPQAVATAPAPSLAPWGVAIALLGLGAIAYRRLRR